MSAITSIVRCGDYQPEKVLKKIKEGIALLGGLDSFVSPGDRVLLKPNFLIGRSPEKCVNTHPAVVQAVAQLVLEAGAQPVIGDSPQMGSALKVAEKCGIAAIARELGIEIVQDAEPENFEGETIVLEEVNIGKLGGLLKFFGEPLSDIDFVAVAVQDHGVFPEEMSNRRFRINKIRELLKKNPKPEAFAFRENEIPPYYPRMRSAVHASKRQLPNAQVLVMDTSPDAILGCLMDPVTQNADPILAVNVGNGHTMAAIISECEVTAVLEHHTRLLNPQKIEKLLKDFADGKLRDKEVFDDNGHGIFYLKKPPDFSEIEKVVVTGPNRKVLVKTDLEVHFATPAGDVMMTGPIGLVEATKRKLK